MTHTDSDRLTPGRHAKAMLVIAVVLSGLPASCVLALFAVKTAENRTRYDRGNPDYQYVVSRLPDRGQPNTLDLSRINGSDWQFICLIGNYSDPAKILGQEAIEWGSQSGTSNRYRPNFWAFLQSKRTRVLSRGWIEPGTNAQS